MEEGIRAGLERREAAKRLKALRWFGVGLAVILGFFAWKAQRAGRPWAPAEAALALAALAAGLLKPLSLLPVYRPWMKAAGYIARFNTALVMGLFYYLIVTPYGLIARWCGASGLDESKPGEATYWTSRAGLPPRDSYRAQF
jgi:hypothetical protein